MLINQTEIPNNLIFKYCKIIKLIENSDKNYDSYLEHSRECLHNEIFEYGKHDRSLYRRCDREFNKALNIIVISLTTDTEF